MTFDQVRAQVFDSKQEDVTLTEGLTLEPTFALPKGFCSELKGLSMEHHLIAMETKSNINVFLDDPRFANNVWIYKHSMTGNNF